MNDNPADVELVSTAWKDAKCVHYPDAVCVPCSSEAILRALDDAGRLRLDDEGDMARALLDANGYIDTLENRIAELRHALRDRIASPYEALAAE